MQADFTKHEEVKEGAVSDDEFFEVHESMKPQMRDVEIQTSDIHFAKITQKN